MQFKQQSSSPANKRRQGPGIQKLSHWHRLLHHLNFYTNVEAPHHHSQQSLQVAHCSFLAPGAVLLVVLPHSCRPSCSCSLPTSISFKLRSVSKVAMAMARSRMIIAVSVVAMLVVTATAASAPNCDSAASSLLPCYSYVTGPDVKPPTDCCGGLSSLNTNSPACLCQLITQLNGTTGAGSTPAVNITKGLNLPKDCSITLNVNDCPALANLPIAPPSGTSPSSAAPVTAGPVAGPAQVPGSNDVSTLLPTSWMMGVAAAAAVGLQALF